MKKNLPFINVTLESQYSKSNISEKKYKGKSLLYFPDSFVLFDLETTGLSTTYDEIIEIGAIKIVDNKQVGVFSTLVKPAAPIDEYIEKLTGITNDMLADAPSIDNILSDFLEFVGDSIVVAHNANFDVNFIYCNCLKYCEKNFSNDYVDTMRLSRKLLRELEHHRLKDLVEYFEIPAKTAHRALSDCEMTLDVYNQLKNVCFEKYSTTELPINDSKKTITKQKIDINNINPDNELKNKTISFKGSMQKFDDENLNEICKEAGIVFSEIFTKKVDILVLGTVSYNKYLRADYSEYMMKANKRINDGTLIIISENDFLEKILFNYVRNPEKMPRKHISDSDRIKSLKTQTNNFDVSHPLYGKECVFTGTLERMLRKDAMQIVLDFGGTLGKGVTKKTNYLILGNNDYCSSIKGGKSSKQKKAEEYKLKGQDIEIISEDVFYDMIDDTDCTEFSSEPLEEDIQINEDEFYNLIDIPTYTNESNSEINGNKNSDEFAKSSNELCQKIKSKIEKVINSDYLTSTNLEIKPSKNLNSNIYFLSFVSEPTPWRLEKTEKNLLAIKLGQKSYVAVKYNYHNLFLKYNIPYTKIKSEDLIRISIDNFFDIDETVLSEIINNIFINLFSIQPFGCCGKFDKCKIKGYCIHDDMIYATACQYRKFIKKQA